MRGFGLLLSTMQQHEEVLKRLLRAQRWDNCCTIKLLDSHCGPHAPEVKKVSICSKPQIAMIFVESVQNK